MYDFSFFVQIQQENVGFLCDVPYNGMVSNQTDWQCRVHHCKLSKHDGSHISQVRKILLKLIEGLLLQENLKLKGAFIRFVSSCIMRGSVITSNLDINFLKENGGGFNCLTQ